jgi:hypothetical protein
VKGILGGGGEGGEGAWQYMVHKSSWKCSLTVGLGLNEHETSLRSLPYSTTSNEGL